ncbi:hypothetical protein [Micromonospora sp. C41]|uniref:hypothetical protein n=1 Tax=Micromonospora sp. C41 TaxID=2824878 RepID=UPI001B398D4A|nr:hypothetical protein [Micromonospora sp. C41]MBQ1064510.1 hypothetical protein [Micromonospora sp. C41]
MTSTNPQTIADTFNTEHGSVTWVRYWTGTRDDAPKYDLTNGKAWLLGGHTPVVRLRGEPSCIALTHVDVLPSQPDDIADDSRDLPDPVDAAQRVKEYISATGDGIYDVVDGEVLYARDLEALRRAAERASEVEMCAEKTQIDLEKERARSAQMSRELAEARAGLEQWRATYGEDALRNAQQILADRDAARAEIAGLTAANQRLLNHLHNATPDLVTAQQRADQAEDRATDLANRLHRAEQEIASHNKAVTHWAGQVHQLQQIANAAAYEVADGLCLDGECDHEIEDENAPCPFVETRHATAAELLAVKALLMSSDGDPLDDGDEIPVGEIRRVLGEARAEVA